ncbi:MAG TPA: ABC transporter ATP-binding protein [Bacteriovoracaceae bacterium]|nr:ABC transporter ATP-binding protein [Bacteriovoracaceae bacterium]
MDTLVVDELQVNYGNVHALKSVSFNVPKGKIVSLIGANGAGKTTTLKAISGAINSTGTVVLNGQNIAGLESYKLVGKGLIHAPEGRGIFPNLTVMENLQLGIVGRHSAKVHFDKNLAEAFRLFPRLKERIAQMAGTLSGGEQQMLAIARALIGEPEILLLDEPSLGLAPQVVKLIFEIIVNINKEKHVTVLLVEQNAKQALKISDYAYVLETGKISLHGKGSDLLDNEDVKKIYLGEH